MTNTRWTEADDQRLREMYASGAKARDAAEYFGRTMGAIQMRVNKLGLTAKAERGERSPSWMAIQRICADGKPRTFNELAALVGVTPENISHLLRARQDKGLAHIAHYAKVSGRPRAFWLPIPGVDAEHPEPAAQHERQRRYQKRQRIQARMDRAAAEVQIPPGQHEIIRALFGMGAPA